MRSSPLRVLVTAGAIALLVGAEAASAQDASSRRIDSAPKIVLGPPEKPAPHSRTGSGAPDDVAPVARPDYDRGIDLELDLKEHRDAIENGSSGLKDYVAAIACVVGSALVLVIVLVVASKRRGR